MNPSSTPRFGRRQALLLAASLLLLPAARACSVCGCSLSLDWAAQGYSTQPGLAAAVRFEYFDQDRLFAGTARVDRAALALPNDQEIQQRTLNRNTWLDVDYATDRWSFRAQVPWHDRYHTTIAGGDTDVSTSQASGLGDVRLLARLQPTEDFHGGFQVGLKLPTGGFRQNFSAGPQEGMPLDRGLQLGTGTWDLHAGGFWFASPARGLDAFVQADVDQPLAARAGFLPSTSATVSAGLRWNASTRLTPSVQLNTRWESREHGPESDRDNSGGTRAYLSPGVTIRLGGSAQAFGFVQLPIYRRVNGLQLDPQWMLTLGLRQNF